LSFSIGDSSQDLEIEDSSFQSDEEADNHQAQYLDSDSDVEADNRDNNRDEYRDTDYTNDPHRIRLVVPQLQNDENNPNQANTRHAAVPHTTNADMRKRKKQRRSLDTALKTGCFFDCLVSDDEDNLRM